MQRMCFILLAGCCLFSCGQGQSVSSDHIDRYNQQTSFFSSFPAESGSTSQNQSINFPISYTPIQTTTWSCGPNSLSRLLHFYHYSTTYEQIKTYAENLIPRIFIPTLGIDLRFGSPPEILKKIGDHWVNGQNFTYEMNSQLNKLKSVLYQSRPVMLLIYSYSQTFMNYEIPLLHWVVVSGYDPQKKSFKISDPGYKDPYWVDEQRLNTLWNWKVSDPTVKSYYDYLKYQPGSMVYLN